MNLIGLISRRRHHSVSRGLGAAGSIAKFIRNRRGPGVSLLRRDLASLVALILLAPSQSSAQTLQSFEDLALRVNLDDRLRVEDQSGVRTTGRLTQLTRETIVIQTEAGEKRFTRDTVRAVAVRGHALRKGALIGAGALAAVGAWACWGRNHETSTNCASW